MPLRGQMALPNGRRPHMDEHQGLDKCQALHTMDMR